jgi:hypothetical protein
MGTHPGHPPWAPTPGTDPGHPSSIWRREQSVQRQQALFGADGGSADGLLRIFSVILLAQIIRGAFATGDAYFRSGDLLRYDDQVPSHLGGASAH